MSEQNAFSIFQTDAYRRFLQEVQQINTFEDATRLLSSLWERVKAIQWCIVEVYAYLVDNKPEMIQRVDEFGKVVLQWDRSFISQLKRVAKTFGNVSDRFEGLSISHHIVLSYASDNLTRDEIRRLGKLAEDYGWTVDRLRNEIKQLEMEKLIKRSSIPTGEETKLSEAVSTGEQQETAPPAPTVERVDLKAEMEANEKAERERKLQLAADAAIKATHAFLSAREEFINCLRHSLGQHWWEFFRLCVVISTQSTEDLPRARINYDFLMRVLIDLSKRIGKVMDEASSGVGITDEENEEEPSD